jgi:hypothetical protein
MRRPAKVAIGVAAVAAGYLVLLVVAGWAAGGLAARTLRDRLALTLDGEAAVGDASVALVRGKLVATDVSVERRHFGTLRLDIDRIDVEVAPLGAVIFDRDPAAIRVRGGRLVITGAAALDLPERARHQPIEVGSVEIVDSELTIAAASAWQDLARVHIVLERVRAGPTRFRTPLSWLFALEALSARVELPGQLAFTVTYADGVLSARGSLFGDVPVTVPFTLPRRPGDDEAAQLRALAFELGKRLAAERARRWFLGQALRRW